MPKRHDYRLKKEMLSTENDLTDGLESIGKKRCLLSLWKIFYAAGPFSKVNNRTAWIWVRNFHGQPAATQHGTLPGKGSLRQIFLLKITLTPLPFIILTSKICPKISLEINFSFSTYCFPMGRIVVQLFVANLIKSSYLESYLLAETIKTPRGIAITGDKKP